MTTHNIEIGSLSEILPHFLSKKSYSKLIILTDDICRDCCLPLLYQKVPILREAFLIVVPTGEVNKNIATCSYIWQQLLHICADRHALLLNLGGGVIGDMGGFAAATYKRGINFVQIPTTLLAQVDASVGGKLAIDFEGLKNVVGLFQHPCAVAIDPDFLATLPQRHLLSGYAEMLKHALIADKNHYIDLLLLGKKLGLSLSMFSSDLVQTPISNAIFPNSLNEMPISDAISKPTISNFDVVFSDLTLNLSISFCDLSVFLTKSIASSVAIKQQIVAEDPTEQEKRKILNFGHTIGHALESWSLANESDPLLHGEAVVWGMIAELYLSHLLLGFPVEELQSAVQYMKQFAKNMPNMTAENQKIDAVLWKYIGNDKKNVAGKWSFTLLRNIADPVWDITVSPEEVKRALAWTFKS